MLFVTGDIHGQIDIHKLSSKNFKLGKSLTKNDYVVCTGDFGLIWDVNKSTPEEQYWLDWLSNKPWTTLFVDGNHECVSKDSEILTELGWMNTVDVYKSKNIKIANFDIITKQIVFELPLNKIKSYKKEAILIEGKNTKQIVSFDHDIIINDKKVKAIDVFGTELKENVFTLKGNNQYKGINISDSMISLLTWVIMDGTIVDYSIKNPNSKKCRIQFKLSKKNKIDKLLTLLSDMKLSYTHRVVSVEGNNILTPHIICLHSDTARMINNALSGNKQIPFEWRNFNKEQVLVFLNTLIETDGSCLTTGNNPIVWRSTNKHNTDIVQEFCIRNDIYCVIKKFENYSGFKNGKPQYISRIYFNKKLNTFVMINKIPYTDYMYCFTMPKGTLITRIDGKVAFTGNCFDRLYELPVIDKFGGKVGKVTDSIYHLRRGEVYNILDKKIFTFGGADSIDKLSRIVNISWWKEEIPSYKEVHHALDSLEENDYNVDYIFTHTCPTSVANQIRVKYDHYKIPNQVELMLEDFNKRVKFNEWYFGHWHIDDEFEDKYFCQYRNIKRLI